MSEEKTKNPIQIIQERRRNERERQEAFMQERRAEQIKEHARIAYLNAGGEDEGFEKSFPAMRERIIVDAAVAAIKGRK
jgi:hypothetical protein